jgi:hypothetical protein
MALTVDEEILALKHAAEKLKHQLETVQEHYRRLCFLYDQCQTRNTIAEQKLNYARGFIHSCFKLNTFLAQIPPHISDEILYELSMEKMK